MHTLKKLTALFCLTVLVLSMMPSSYAASGYRVKHWTDVNDYETTNFYYVYQGALDPMYAPTFYCEGGDYYTNIYTGWDVVISFYRQYDSASPEQAAALCSYLTSHSDNKYSSAGYYYFTDDDFITSIYVWFIDGWDVYDSNLDIQDLWDREFWMNRDAVGLYLEYLGYGRSDSTWQNALKQGCSSMVTVQENEKYGFPGITFGFHFVEGTDEHVVKRYCPNETWS